MPKSKEALPVIDDRVKHCGASFLRRMNATALKKLAGPVVIQESNNPLAVLVPYDMYLLMQAVSKP